MLENFINRITPQFADIFFCCSLSSLEQNAHNASMQVKSEFFVGRETELKALLSYIKDGSRESQSLRLRTERQTKTPTEETKTDEEREREEDEMRKKAEELRNGMFSIYCFCCDPCSYKRDQPNPNPG